MSMTIPASVITGSENKYKLNINGYRENRNVKKQKEELPKTSEDILIEQFKEENSPEKTKVSDIYAKFQAGKELTPDELKYLADNEPEIYKEVMEIIRERKAMEMQMKQADTKQEVQTVHLNKMTNIKKTMGYGKQAESQATKTLARVNQMMDAFAKFTSTAEYREKDDERSQAISRREKLLELEELLEELNHETDDKHEKVKKILILNEENDNETEEKKQKKHKKHKIDDDNGYIGYADYDLLKLRIDKLYQQIRDYGGNKTNTHVKTNGIDLFL